MNANPRRLLFAWVLCCAALVPPCLRGDEAGDAKPLPISEIVRDGDGEIWGIDPRTAGGLYRYVDGRWLETPVHDMAEKKCRALALVRRADGAAVCLWGNPEKERYFSVQRGRQTPPSEPVAFAHPDPGPGHSYLFADSKNNVWLTNSSPYICRLSPDGTAGCVRVLGIEEGFLPGQRPGAVQIRVDGWEQVLACEDAQGRVWFYSHGFYARHLLLRGLLGYDGENFTLRDPLPPANAQRHLGLLAPKDAGHLWLNIVYDGLYVLDTATFALERVADQPVEARGTPEVFARGPDDWLFVLHGFGANALHSLWSLRAGHWEKLVDSLDADTQTGSSSHRLWTRAEGGFFLGSTINGLWFVPDRGSPRLLNWRQGFPVTSPVGLVRLSEPGRWLCADDNAHVWTGPLDEILTRAEADGSHSLGFVRAAHPLVSDRRRHLWGLRDTDFTTLGEWDGEKWTTRPLPTEGLVGSWYRRAMGVDGAQRVWLIDAGVDRTTFLIYDPARDHWDQYEGFEGALEAQIALGKEAELPTSEYADDLARFGPRGQISYLHANTMLGWYDGERWRHWKRSEVHGPDPRHLFDGPPFFTGAGTLAININKETWEYAGENVWKRAEVYQPGYADYDVRYAASRRTNPPQGSATQRPESIVLDNQGLYWLTWEQRLYRCRDGLCVPVFRPGEVQPFIDGRRLTSAFIDGRGNSFLQSADRHEYVILAPPGPLPRTSVEIVAATGAGARSDTRDLRLGTDAAAIDGKVRLEWRLDGGDWQTLAVEKPPATVALDALRNGPHRFEARSFDAALQTDATPTGVEFRVDFDPQARIAGYIAQLADPDDARRKEAVFALARQPELALPALRAARARAVDENQRWWIDAALQQAGAAR